MKENIEKGSESNPVKKESEVKKYDDTISVTFNDLKDILMDAIQKVKNDPEYIPQANATKGLVDTMLNAAKTQLQIVQQRDKFLGK